MSAESKEKIFSSQFLFVFGALFFTSLVMYLLMSPITEYASNMGSSASIAGLASGIYVIGGLLSLMYSSHALKTWGWKKTVYVFLSIHLLACILYFILNGIYGLLIARFIHGIGMGAGGAAIITIATPIFPKKRFGEAMGIFLLGTPLAVGIGPIIGSFLLEKCGAGYCFASATIFAALALLCMFFVEIRQDNEKEKDIDRSKYKGIRKVIEPPALPISLMAAFLSMGYVAIISFYDLYAEQVNLVNEFQYFFIIYSIVLIAGRPLGGKIQDKYGDWLVTIVPIILQFIGIFLIAVHPSMLTIIICAVCTGLGFGTFYSIANTMVARNATEERSPYAISTFLIIIDTALGFGPAFLGLFVVNGNYTFMFLVASFISLFALPLSYVALKR